MVLETYYYAQRKWVYETIGVRKVLPEVGWNARRSPYIGMCQLAGFSLVPGSLPFLVMARESISLECRTHIRNPVGCPLCTCRRQGV
jgi:hypothetical protein